MPQYNTMQTIKRRFFAMRNGVIADTLRKAGLDYRMIFGLNLPQIAEIAAGFTPSATLARELWDDRRTRESMLLAPMLFPIGEMDRAEATRWLAEAPTTETADVLCLKLLRQHPEAADIAMDVIVSEEPQKRYAALRLMLNLLTVSPDAKALADEFKPFAEAEAATRHPLTYPVSRRLLEEIEWLAE